MTSFVNDFVSVWNRLRGYYDEADAHAWLYAPHPQLQGERPIELIRLGRTQEVAAILDRLDSGAYL
jgi:uncharacterized protein (DUF2384 family)